MNTDKHRCTYLRNILSAFSFICVPLRSSAFPLIFLLLLTAIAWGAQKPGQITIDAPLFEGGAGKAFFLQCARDYEKIRPNVHVNMYLDPRIADKVRVRILEGSWFELTNAFVNFWPLIDNGEVLKLNKYLDGPNWEHDSTWRDSFLPGTLNGYEDTHGNN
ncbi:MAG TPA: hypothetical protein VG722_06900, partial [Tepidisphaeraceae bacterium]|nr:hypothetical protein [Tepidisphaeraceae bacterium]